MQSSSSKPHSSKFPLRDITASYHQNIPPSSATDGFRRAVPTPTYSASYYSAKINNDERIAKELAPITHLLRRISNSCGKHAEWQQRKAEQLRCTTHMLRSVRQRLLHRYVASGGNNNNAYPSQSKFTLQSAAALVIPRVDLPVASSPAEPLSSHTLPITSVLPLLPVWCSSILPENDQQQPRISNNSNAEIGENSDGRNGIRAAGMTQRRHALRCLLHVLVTYGTDLPSHTIDLLTATVSCLTSGNSTTDDDQAPLLETLVARVELLVQQ